MHLIGRDAELTALRAATADGRSAVVLGLPGSGRTSVLQRLAEAWTLAGRAVWRVHGSETVAGVPLAAFAPVIAAHDLDLSAPITIYSVLPGRLRDAAAVVVVDDVGDLDRASAVLIAQLSRAGVVCVAAAADRADLLRTVTDPAVVSGWTTIPLPPLDSDEVLTIAADRLGDHLAAPSAALLVRHAAGNPGLVAAILDAAAPSSSAAGAVLDRVVVTDEVRRLVRFGPHDVADPARRDVVEWLAVAGPLPLSVLNAAVAEGLERDGVVVVDDDAVRLAHELVDDVVLADLGELGARRRRREVVDLLGDLDGWQGTCTLTAIRAGLDREPADVRRGVRAALADDRVPEALELLEAIAPVTEAADLVLLGAAQSAAGDVDDAAVTLGRAESAAATDDERVRIGQELGLLFAVRRSDPSTAVERVEAVAGSVEEAARRAVLDGDLVKWRRMAGQDAGLVEADPGTDDVAAVNHAVIGAMVHTMGGDLDLARAAVETGLAAVERTADAPPFSGDLLRLSQYLATAFGGDVAGAEAFALEHRDAAARGPAAALGMWEFAAAELALHAGRLDRARQMSDRAARHLVWRDFTGLQASALSLRAAVAARQGRRSAARDLRCLVDDQQRTDVKVELHVARADAETELARGRPAAAAEVLATAARRAAAEGHGHLAVLALDEAFMVAPSTGLAAELATTVSSPLADLLHHRAAAQAAGDAVELAGAARELHRIGMPGRAVQALTAAAAWEERRGSGERARRLRREAVALAAEERIADWPSGSDTGRLTDRELYVARLAACRIRSREIAEQLGLSVRTVDNHLARAFRKLGIARREDLADALMGETDLAT